MELCSSGFASSLANVASVKQKKSIELSKGESMTF
jgi:hypothetical protein